MERPRLFLTIFIIVAFMTPIVAVSINETKVVVTNLVRYKPKVLIKLDIHIPREGKGKCFVLVRRFSSMLNPTYDGYTEKVYVGVHRPGTVVEVEKVLNAYVVKSFEYISYGGGTKTYHYYEPQEFFVALLCKNGNTTTLKWGKVVEVYPNKIIYRKDIYPSKQSPKQTNERDNVITPSSSSNQLHCTFTQKEYKQGAYRRGSCVTFVRGPWLYSTWSAKTRYGITAEWPLSAVYIGAFGDFDAGPAVKPESQVDWMGIGKKLVASSATTSTSPLAGPYKDRLYFDIKYIYEWSRECGFSSFGCYSYWLIYPGLFSLYGVHRSGAGAIDGILNETTMYSPPTVCQHSCSLITRNQSVTIFFHDDNEFTSSYTPYHGDVPIASTRIVFDMYKVWSSELEVYFYKSIRDDTLYTTPFVEIVNNGTSNIYWWYESGDPSYLTVRLCCGMTRPH